MWAYESVFYQIYPLGFCGAPFENDGELNRRIEILRFQETHDEYGGIDGEWLPLLKRWGKIEDNGGNESSSGEISSPVKPIVIKDITVSM